MPLRLGIDLDGVVADFNTGWIERYNRDFDADIQRDAVQVWDGLHELTHFAHMDEFWEWARRQTGGSSLFRHLEPYEGALDALGRLESEGHAVIILTSKPDWAVHDTFEWLAHHRVPTREVHVTEQKHRVACDVYLDDAPHQLLKLHEMRPEALICRYVRPWNEPLPGIRDVTDWEDFVGTVRSVAGPVPPG